MTADRTGAAQLADLLRARRAALGLTLSGATQACSEHCEHRDLSENWYRRIEDGGRRALRPWELRALAQGLRIEYRRVLQAAGY